MTTYEYKCVGPEGEEGCGQHFTHDTRHDFVMGRCTCTAKENPTWPNFRRVKFQRVWSVAVKPMMHEHFNHTLGAPVSDMKQFATELRIKGEQAEEQTGIPHRYAPLEYGDHDAFGATGEGIYESNVHRSRRGEPLLPLIE